MKKTFLFLFVNVLLCNFSFANNNPTEENIGTYSITNIPSELMEDANAVIRNDYTLVEVESIKNATVKYKYAITILNSKADNYAHFFEYYSPFIKLSDISGVIYDKDGKKIRKIKKKEIHDLSAVSNISIYDDNRKKVVEVNHNEYPYTIEFEYEKRYKGILSYPWWTPVPNYNISVQSSYYKIKVPEGNLRFQSRNFPNKPESETKGNYEIYKWTLENFAAKKREPYCPKFKEIFPTVQLAPNKFEYDGWEGDMSSWETFGKFFFELEEGRDELDNSTIAKVKQLVADKNNDEEKIRAIYEYLQSKTRYISIQLGIGGWQPFKAKDVDKDGYGDCKALSNYTKAMLKAADIKAYNVVIGAGENHKSLDPNFSGLGTTNHMILCVPMEHDTIWLECTSQNAPFGFLGDFTDDRTALLITEEGGKIARTPRYHQSINTQIREATAKIETDGTAHVSVNTKYGGLQYENVNYQLIRNKEEQKEVLFKRLDISNVDLKSFTYSQKKERIPTATEDLELVARNYANVSGQRIFIPLNMLNKRKRAPKKMKDRKTNLTLTYEYVDEDKITYELPEGYHIEHLPESIDLESDFGSYKMNVIKEGNTIIYYRKVKMNKGSFPPERYNDFRSFYKKMVKYDKKKLVIVNKT